MAFMYGDRSWINLDHVISIDCHSEKDGYVATLTNGKTARISSAFDQEIWLHNAAFLPATGDHVLHFSYPPNSPDEKFSWQTETIIGWFVNPSDQSIKPVTMYGVHGETNPRLIEDTKTGKFRVDEYDGGEFDSRDGFEKYWRQRERK